jgi:hypothetical protein
MKKPLKMLKKRAQGKMSRSRRRLQRRYRMQQILIRPSLMHLKARVYNLKRFKHRKKLNMTKKRQKRRKERHRD